MSKQDKKKSTVLDAMAAMTQFVQEFQPKEAGELGPENDEMATSDSVTEDQGALGKEQAAKAKGSGATVGEITNTEDKAKEPADDKAPVTMKIDDTAKAKSEVMPKPIELEQEMTQKAARAAHLRNSLLTLVKEDAEAEQEIQKEASDFTATEEGRWLMKEAEDSMAKAQEFYQEHLAGKIQRRQDEQILKEANLDQELLTKFGGIDGLLDKLAEMDEAAIQPTGVEEAGALPPDDEMMAEQLALIGEEAGLSPEEMDTALEVVFDLMEKGNTPEQIMEAVQEEAQTMAPEEAGAAEVPAEIPADVPAEVLDAPPADAEAAAADVVDAATQVPPEEALPKVASDESAVAACREIIRAKLLPKEASQEVKIREQKEAEAGDTPPDDRRSYLLECIGKLQQGKTE